jgi:hypothetical protein
VPLAKLVAWPLALTVAVTLLRLVGELRHWSPEWFSPLPGGGLARVGIVWLAPVVGFWFGWRLQRAGVRAPALGRAAGVPLAALLGALALGWLAERQLGRTWQTTFALWAVVSLLALAAGVWAWPALGRVLLAYAVAARAAVAAVAAVAVWRSWGTHYDAPPPGFPALPQLKRWLWTGLLPQMTVWVAFTVLVGAACGALGWLAASRTPRRAR